MRLYLMQACMTRRPALLLACVGVMIVGHRTAAQAPALLPRPDSAESASSHVGVWIGFARTASLGILGNVGDRKIAMTGIRWVHPIRRGPLLWEYTMDVIPYTEISDPRPEPILDSPCSSNPECYLRGAAFGPTSTSGVGFVPLGLQVRKAGAHGWSPYLSSSIGIVRYSRKVPTERASRVNAMLDVGGGTLVSLPRTTTRLQVAYRFLHISNAGTAPANPGVAAHLFTVGLIR